MSSAKQDGARGGLTRRRFVQAGAGALVAAGVAPRVGLGAAEEAGPAGGGGGGGPDVDAIVIGAGFAGVTASRELRRAGLRVLLLEAHGRVGGRTFTSELAGHAVELGGAYVHWSQPHVWSEITRYGLALEEPAREAEPRYAWLAEGKRHEGGPEQLFGLGFEAAAHFFHDARAVLERPHDPLASTALAALDGQSVADRLSALGLPEASRAFLDAIFGSSCHCALSEAGLVEMLRWYALSGFGLLDYFDAVGRYTLRGGTRELLGAMLADAAPELRTATPVRAIRQTPAGVVVTTEEDETVSARVAVVTVPLNTLGKIAFDPPLSAGKQAAAREGHAGSGVKLHVRVRGRTGGFLGLAPWPAPISTLSAKDVDADSTLFTAFGPSAKLLDINDDARVQEAVRLLLPGAELIEAVGYDWNVDPFVRGTWCVFRPGQLTGRLRALQQREGRVVYAGADNASGWRGFIDGAIESGLRASREVQHLLG